MERAPEVLTGDKPLQPVSGARPTRLPLWPFARLPRAASFECIRLNMLSKWLLASKESCPVIGFTSRARGEGVSTVVAGLARSFEKADPGRVLALDASGAKRGVARLLRARAVPIALPARAVDMPDLRGCVTRAAGCGVDVLVLGNAGPLRLGSASFAQAAVEALRPAYRTRLVDAGALPESWAACWLACSNYRVLVVDSSSATREVLEHERLELERSGISLDGSILNKRAYPIPRLLYWLAH